MLQNEAYINQIWREFLKYGNPGSYFWDKNKLFSQISGNWLKIWPKMIFVVSFKILYIRTLISKYKKGEQFKKIFLAKINKNKPLDSYMEPISPQNSINVFFLPIFTTHQNFEFLMHISRRIMFLWAPKVMRCAKKFHRLHGWWKNSKEFYLTKFSLTICPGARVARYPKTPVRFCWYIPYFEAFYVPIHLHLVSWMGKVGRFWGNCVDLPSSSLVLALQNTLNISISF